MVLLGMVVFAVSTGNALHQPRSGGGVGVRGSLSRVFSPAGEDSGRGKENDSVVKTRERPATD